MQWNKILFLESVDKHIAQGKDRPLAFRVSDSNAIRVNYKDILRVYSRQVKSETYT